MCDCLVLNGTHYPKTAYANVIAALEDARQRGIRVRVHYGEADTGRDWCEEHDVEGYIGRSMGPCRIPLLIHSRRCYGGGGILVDCIVRIREARGGRELYRHPSYNVLEVVVRPCDVTMHVQGTPVQLTAEVVDVMGGETVHARFRTMEQAHRWARRMGLTVEDPRRW